MAHPARSSSPSLTILAVLGDRPQAIGIVGLVATLGAPRRSLVIGVARPRLATSASWPGSGSSGAPGPTTWSCAGLGRTFQNIRLFQNMTALENVLVGMHSRLHADAGRRAPVDAAEPRARRRRPGSGPTSSSTLVGLAGRGDQLAKNLPYGDQRRLEIARALGERARAAPARRADRRHEPERDAPS